MSLEAGSFVHSCIPSDGPLPMPKLWLITPYSTAD